MSETLEVRGPAARATDEPEFHKVFRRTVTWRVVHWVNVASIIAATVTGIYIARPFFTANAPFLMAWNRAIHFYAAIVLDVSVILIAYLYFFSRAEREAEQLRPSRSNLGRLQESFLNVVMLNRRRRLDTARPDPFNAILFVILHLLAVLQLFTGFQMYVTGLESGVSSIGSWWPSLLHLVTDWTWTVFGGAMGVRMAHHTTMYLIVAWALLHIYYEIWRTVMWKEGDITIMFGGYKFARRSSREHP